MAALILCFVLIAFPDGALRGAGIGLEICLRSVVPSLLPFMLLSSMALNSGGGERIGRILAVFLKPLGLNKASSVCFITGLLGGYPCGGKAVGQMVKNGSVSKADGAKMLAFCNNSGPLFIIGAVGTAVYNSAHTGILLYGCHVFGAAVSAFIFGGKIQSGGDVRRNTEKIPIGALMGNAAKDGGEAILSVCAVIITFSALTESLGLYRLPMLMGLIEVSRGAAELGRYGISALPLAAAYISWGGLSVHFQTEAVTMGISKKYYYVGKIISALSSGLAMLLCIKLFPGRIL